MNVIYQSPNYKPEIITDRYLRIDLKTGIPIVDETVKTKKTNYTYRSYELPEEQYASYAKCIIEAGKLRGFFPCSVELKEN